MNKEKNGDIRIENNIWEALTAYRISGEEMKCLMFIIRKTVGWNKKQDNIPLLQFIQATTMAKSSVCRAISKLKEKNMVFVYKEVNKTHSTYEFNKKYKTWEAFTKRSTIYKKVNVRLQKSKSTIDTNTKDTRKTCSKEQVSVPDGTQETKIGMVNRNKNKPMYTIKETHYSKKTKHIVDYYYSFGFKNSPLLNTKISQNINTNLNRLFRGTLFNDNISLKKYHDRKFTGKEIKAIIDRHTIKATDNSFKPKNKKYLLVHLDIFLYNEFGKIKSHFIESFENEPEPLISIMKDRNPELSKALFKIYNQEAQNGLSTYVFDALPTRDKNCFISGAFRLNNFLKLNQSKVVQPMIGAAHKKALLLWKTIMLCANDDIKKINPFWFQADWVFDRLPNYMSDRGFLQAKIKDSPLRREEGK